MAGTIQIQDRMTATIVAIDTSGDTQWALILSNEEGNESEGSIEPYPTYIDGFSSAVAHGDAIIALHTRGHIPFAIRQYAIAIQNGIIINEVELPYIVDGIYPSREGFLSVRFVGVATEGDVVALIENRDMHGNTLWETSHPYNWAFEGIIHTSEGYLAYGIEITEELEFNGVMVMFDEVGNLLWRHISEDFVSIVQCIMAEDTIMMIGNAITDRRLWTLRGCTGTYDERGMVWRREPSPNDVGLKSFAAVDDGYIAIGSSAPPS